MVTKAKKALLASLAAFLCVMLTVFGLSMSVSLSETAKAADETSAVAKVGTTTTYGTLKGAIDAAADGNTVTLLKDTTEDVVVDKNITLDLDGKTLTGTKTANKASLTVVKGATATVKNGTILGTENGYYTIQNNGTATFENLTATAGNTGSSMIDNWGTLTITSGTYFGGLNVVKSEEGSKLTINGGKFTLNYSKNYSTPTYTGVVFAYGDTTITGGEFIQSVANPGKWHHPCVVLTGVVEGYTAITRVTGGSFTNLCSGEGIFRGVGKGTSDNFEVFGGTFNKSISDGYCADGFIPTKQADGTYGVKVGKYVAKVGSTKYETLKEAFNALKSGSYKLTLLDENVWDASTPVYWRVNSDKSGYTKTLAEALTAVYKANGRVTCKIVCRPGADVGTLTHGHVADSINIYGNNAYISGGECDLEVDTFKFNRTTGAQANDGVALDKDITINAYELDNLGVWGQRTTNHKVTVNLTDCDGKEIAGKNNVQRVYISGTTGVNNLTIQKCDFLTKATSIYSNADGKIIVSNCTFTGAQVPLNINHKADGAVTLEVKNSTFTSCGDAGDWKKFAAPARFVNSGSGTMTVTANKLTFNGTVGSNGDILLGDGREGQKSNGVTLKVTSTAANIQAQKPGYYNDDGTTNETKVGKETIKSSTTAYTTSIEDLAPEKGSEKNPYTLEELGAMTRAEYIAAQEKLGGTMYVTVGNYSYDKNGVLGNGVRDDTPGQTPDHSKLNAYGENGYLGEKNDGANGKNVVFVGGSITSGATGYTSIDNIGTSLLLAVPAYTNVTFKGTKFNNVMSFNYQLYTSPWSQLGELKFDGCTFNGLIVGAIASQTLTFNGCTFTDYTNTVSANSSNPTWIRPAYGNWTKGDNEGQGGDFKSLTTINFTGNTVTSTRPVKFERIAQWEMATTVTATENKFTISAQDGDTSTKNVGLYLGANAKFDLKVENNTKLGSTAALYTAVYSAPSNASYAGLPAGSTVTDTKGNGVTVEDANEWKTTKKLTLETTTEVAEVNGVKFATLAEAIAAAKDGETVKLLADVEQNSKVAINKNITLDLNGKKIYNTKDIWNETVSLIDIEGGAKVTVMGDGTIAAKKDDCYTINITDGDLTIENGTFVGNISVVQVVKGKLTINGGTFSLLQKWKGEDRYLINCIDDAFTANNAQVAIYGGSFAGFDPNVSPEKKVDGKVPSFAAPGVGITKNENGSFTAKANMAAQILDSDGNSVAAYATLEEAVNAAVDGQTVMLLTNATINSRLDVEKAITLDLNGKTLTSELVSNGYAILFRAAVTIKNGTVKVKNACAIGTVAAMTMDGVTVENGIIGGHATISLSGARSEYVIRNSTINGAYSVAVFANNATVTIENSKITGRGPALYHNGSNYGLRLTVTDTTLTSAECSVYISGSASMKDQADNRNNADGYQQATFTRCTISGTNGIEVKYTNLTLNSCIISATVKTPTYEQNNNGSTASGFAVVSTDNATGGTTPAPKGTIAVSGEGNYVGAIGIGTLVKNKYEGFEDASYAVSGGKFNHAILPEYCADGFIPQDNGDGTFGVKVGTYVAKIGEAGYETLAEAIAAAKAGDTITLLANVADFEGAVVTKNLTFDFGDYTITGKAGATVLHVKNAKVTLNGKTGGIDGGAGGDNIAVRADTGAEVIINGGVYTVGADANGLGNSTVYVTDNGKVTINGGTFSSKAAYNGKYYVLNVQNSAKGTFEVKGGTFKDFDPLSGDDNLGGNFAPEGYGANRDENGNFTIVAGVVAQVKNASGKSVKAYATLEEALNAAPRKAIVMLLADTRENVTITQMYITLDLNGHTINGGTVNGKPAVTVTARVTIKDSSAAQTGTIMREDTAENSGVSSYYVIDVQGDGWLTFEGGNVINHSGVVGVRGASLVRVGDDSVAEYPGLNIKGGTFTQDNFIAIKVDRGDLFLNGGTLNSANSYAIEDWHRATVKGGTVNGAVAAWAYSGGLNSTLEISGGTINGDVTSVNYGNATDKKATVSVTGGTINGKLDTRSYDPATGDLTSINDAAKATIGVSGGTFSTDPTKYVVEDSAITKNEDGTFGVAKAYLATVGDTSYYTMEEAFKAQTASGEAIVMLRDYTTGSTFNSGTKHRVVDLNRHTWTYTGTDMNSAAFEINNPNATLTVKNGTLISSTIVGLIPSAMGGTIKYDKAGLVFDGVTMTSNGSSGIETNGNNTNDSVTLKNSTLNVPNGFGIYFPSSGTLTIDNSTINAKTMGVQVCSGELNINAGSAITVTGDAVTKTENDGAIQDGAAISIVNRTGYKGLSDIVITGGTFTAKAGNDAIKAYDWNNAENKGSDFTKADLVAVSGGTFSSEVKKDYLADRFVVNKNTDGTYGVTAGSGFAGANVVVTESLAMKVTIANGTASKYVVVTYKGLDGIDKSVKLDTLTDGYYLFDRIMPQMIDVKFSFELYGENDVMLDRKANYSVVDYLAHIIASDKDSAEFRNVAASLIEYANRAKVVKGLTTTVAPTFVDKDKNVVTLDYNAFVAKNKIPAKDTLGAISEGDGQVIYKARVVFDDAYTLKFYANAGDGNYTYKLSKIGSTEEEGITFDENGEFTINVLAQDITTQYVIKVYGEDKTKPIQTVTYGVSTYCIRMQGTETPQGELYVASYYYGVAVQQYGAANTASVQV